jgi:hypothetical protein
MLKTAAPADAALLAQGALRDYQNQRGNLRYQQRAPLGANLTDADLASWQRRN